MEPERGFAHLDFSLGGRTITQCRSFRQKLYNWGGGGGRCLSSAQHLAQTSLQADSDSPKKITSDLKSLKRGGSKKPVTMFVRTVVYMINSHLLGQFICSFNRLSSPSVRGTTPGTRSDTFWRELWAMVRMCVNCLVQNLKVLSVSSFVKLL